MVARGCGDPRLLPRRGRIRPPLLALSRRSLWRAPAGAALVPARAVRVMSFWHSSIVMPGLDPAIHVFVPAPAEDRWRVRFTTEARRARRSTEKKGLALHLRASPCPPCLRGESFQAAIPS